MAVADTIYWTAPYDYAIRGAPLAGGTVDTLYDSAQGVNLPMGLAIDPVRGRICWANYGDSTIRSAPLAAGGTIEELYGPGDGVSDPFGVAIDPVAGHIYWTNGEWSTAGVAGTIRRAPLDGGGAVVDLYGVAHGVGRPGGVAIDRAAGRIYWANGATGEIWRAPLTPGSGGPVGPLYGTPQVIGPQWLAIDPAAGRIYFTHWNHPGDGRVRSAPLAGGGAVDTLYDSARGVSFPGGLAIDPSPAGAVPERLEVATPQRFGLSGWMSGAWNRIRDLFSRDAFSPSPSPPARVVLGQRSHHNVVPGHEPQRQEDPERPARRRRYRRDPLRSGELDGRTERARGAPGPGRNRAASNLMGDCSARRVLGGTGRGARRGPGRRSGRVAIRRRPFRSHGPAAQLFPGQLGSGSARLLPLPHATELRLSVEAQRRRHRRCERGPIHGERSRHLHVPGDRNQPSRERFADERSVHGLMRRT